MMCADIIEASWKDAAGRTGKAAGLLEDISSSGACLQMENAVPDGARIRWRTGRQEFEGTVRYCVYREIGYYLGVEFAHSSRWSKHEFEPQHLFDPRELEAMKV